MPASSLSGCRDALVRELEELIADEKPSHPLVLLTEEIAFRTKKRSLRKTASGLSDHLASIIDGWAGQERGGEKDRLGELRKQRRKTFHGPHDVERATLLAANGVWDHFSVTQQDALNAIRSDWTEAELAYELSRDQVRRIIGKRRPERLAFVVTKGDVLADARLLDPDATIRGLINEEDWMNMGNIVREAKNSFLQVKYFKTAATTGESGSVDASVAALASGLLLAEGIQFARLPLAGK